MNRQQSLLPTGQHMMVHHMTSQRTCHKWPVTCYVVIYTQYKDYCNMYNALQYIHCGTTFAIVWASSQSHCSWSKRQFNAGAEAWERGYVRTHVRTKYDLAWSRKAGFCSTRSTCENNGSRRPRDTRPIPAPQSAGTTVILSKIITSLDSGA